MCCLLQRRVRKLILLYEKYLSFSIDFFFVSCDQVQKDAKDLTKDKIYNPEEQLNKIGISLPEVSAPVANYVRAVKTGNLLFLSGSGPRKSNGEYIIGKVGENLSIEEGYQAARITGINHLATLKSELGNLNKVKRIVKVLGMVNSSPDFTDQPKVINGFSDLMVEVFGERGKHARSAVGMASLPIGIAVEIELIVEVE